VVETFFEQPILNSPYEVPTRHHDLDEDGQPTNLPPLQGRRRSKLITPVPKPRKRKRGAPKQAEMVFADAEGLTDAEQEYSRTIVNEIPTLRLGGSCRTPMTGRSRRQPRACCSTGGITVSRTCAPSSARSRRSRRSSG
jgi:hypothetical protein